MQQIVDTLLPIFLMIGLGWGLAHWKFLGTTFIADLNRLAFYVALPALVFRSVRSAGLPSVELLASIAALTTAIFIAMAVAGLLAVVLRARRDAIGTILHLAFRGNITYVAIPVLAYSFQNLPQSQQQDLLGGMMLIMGVFSLVYNMLAPLCFLDRAHGNGPGLFAAVIRTTLKNPIIIACVAGLAFSGAGLPIPEVADRFLAILGAIALPIALLCIGGSLHGIHFQGRYRSILIASFCKITVVPLAALAACTIFGVGGNELRIVLIMASAPTATIAYTMTRELGGDAGVASATIGLTALLSPIPLAIVLLLT